MASQATYGNEADDRRREMAADDDRDPYDDDDNDDVGNASDEWPSEEHRFPDSGRIDEENLAIDADDASTRRLSDSRDSVERPPLDVDRDASPMFAGDDTDDLHDANQEGGAHRGVDSPTRTTRDNIVAHTDDDATLAAEGRSSPASFPKSLVAQLFTSFARQRPTKDTLQAVCALSEIYLKQVAQDLADCAARAKRRTVELDDVVQLFRRQRLVAGHDSLDDLIRRHLPRETVEQLLPIARAHNTVVPAERRSAYRATTRRTT